MVKTQIFIVCDKCETPLKDTDVVYGYAKYNENRITAFAMDEKNYTDYYFDDHCLNQLKQDTFKQLEKSLTSAVVNKADSTNIYICYIGETYTFYKLDFDEVNATYFYVVVDGYRQLVKVRLDENQYYFSCLRNAVDLMFRNMKQGRLMDLRREFKEEGDRRKLASQMARSSDACAIDCTSSAIDTKVYG